MIRILAAMLCSLPLISACEKKADTETDAESDSNSSEETDESVRPRCASLTETLCKAKALVPETKEAPQLSFKWDGVVDGDTVSFIVPFGVKEGGQAISELSTEYSLDIKGSDSKELYAAGDGLVMNIDDNGVWVRYGEYYIISHKHIEDIKVAVGDEVKAGDLIGYSQVNDYGSEFGLNAFWEVEIDVCEEDGKIYAYPLMGYADAEMKALFTSLWEDPSVWRQEVTYIEPLATVERIDVTGNQPPCIWW